MSEAFRARYDMGLADAVASAGIGGPLEALLLGVLARQDAPRPTQSLDQVAPAGRECWASLGESWCW